MPSEVKIGVAIRSTPYTVLYCFLMSASTSGQIAASNGTAVFGFGTGDSEAGVAVEVIISGGDCSEAVAVGATVAGLGLGGAVIGAAGARGVPCGSLTGGAGAGDILTAVVPAGAAASRRHISSKRSGSCEADTSSNDRNSARA